jgi:hypothetical protein
MFFREEGDGCKKVLHGGKEGKVSKMVCLFGASVMIVFVLTKK